MVVVEKISHALLYHEMNKGSFPVIISSVRDIKKNFYDKDPLFIRAPYTCGCFIQGNKDVRNYPETFLWINQRLPIYQKLGVFYHEEGHAQCLDKNCHCKTSITDCLSEVHAFKFSLKKSLNNRYIRTLRYEIKEIVDMALVEENRYLHSLHSRAARKVMKSKLWLKCTNFVCEYDTEQREKENSRKRKTILQKLKETSQRIKKYFISGTVIVRTSKVKI